MQLFRTLCAVALAVGATLTAACSGQPAAPTAPNPTAFDQPSTTGQFGPTGPTAAAPAPERQAARFEVDFMTGMIDHHAMAIEMSEVCLDKAVHPELHAACENIIATQSAEIEQMQTWLQSWYGVTHEPEMKPGDMKMMERMASMSAEEFEIAFMEMMIRHHRGAIREAEKCLRMAWHEELRSLCQNIIATQSAEIAQFEAWLCEWYGRC